MQRAGKVVAATRWDDQHRKLQPHQCCQVAVNGAVPAEDEDGVGVAGRARKAVEPPRRRSRLKLLQVSR